MKENQNPLSEDKFNLELAEILDQAIQAKLNGKNDPTVADKIKAVYEREGKHFVNAPRYSKERTHLSRQMLLNCIDVMARKCFS